MPKTETPPHVVQHRVGQRLNSLSRQTTSYIEHARGISAALEQFQLHYAGMNDAALKIRCSFSNPAVPSEDYIKAAVGNEVLRLLGTTSALFVSADIGTLISPETVKPLPAIAAQTAIALNTALSEVVDADLAAASRSISLGLTR